MTLRINLRVVALCTATLTSILARVCCNVISQNIETVCGKTVKFNFNKAGVVLKYNYDEYMGTLEVPANCTFKVDVRHLSGVIAQVDVNDVKYLGNRQGCPNNITISAMSNQPMAICRPFSGFEIYSETEFEIQLIRGSRSRILILTLALFSVLSNANSSCPGNFVSCKNIGCVSSGIYCYKDRDFCKGGSSRCSDDNNKGSASVIYVIVFSIAGISIFIVLFHVVCCRFLKMHKKIRMLCCGGSPSPQGPLRAVDVFVVRTSEDDDGTDAGPVDSRMFDPPPDYYSLKNLSDKDEGQVYDNKVDISDELPPHYLAVMTNMADYKVNQV